MASKSGGKTERETEREPRQEVGHRTFHGDTQHLGGDLQFWRHEDLEVPD